MQSLDHYCERTDPSFWAEPFNALSNLAFIAVTWWLWNDSRRHHQTDADLVLLLIWAAAFGVGSLLFHTFANTATFWLDVIPILLFVLTYMWVSARRVLHWSTAAAAGSVALIFLLTLAAGRLAHLLNGAPLYVPTLLMLIGLTVAHGPKRRSGKSMLWATAAFAIALIFRTIDHSICPSFPVGTHFLWHLFTAVAVFFAITALLQEGEQDHTTARAGGTG